MPAELIEMPKSQVLVKARPHVMKMDTYECYFPQGSTIREMVGPNARACRVEIGGIVIPEEMWANVRPTPKVAVVITRFPEGGSAKTIFRLVAFAALAIAVPVLASALSGVTLPALLGGITLSPTAAFAVAGGIGVLGMLTFNALIPPQNPGAGTSGESTDLLKSITGTQNQLNPFGSIPVVLGTVKMFPPYASKPFTELSGDDQYLRVLFDLGQGDPIPSDMKIGNTDLADYTDVETEIGENPSLFPADVEETSLGVTLNTDGNTATRGGPTGAVESSLDLAFASGLFGLDSTGNVLSTTCRVKIEYTLHGGSSWNTVGPSTTGLTLSSSAAVANVDGTIHVTNAARKAVRIGVRWKHPIGQYDFRVTRVDTNWGGADADARVGDLTWTVVRAIRSGRVSTTGTKKLALRIKANDQLNGTINQFSCIVSQPIPVWNPEASAWDTQVSSNPAWLYRWIMRDCPATKKKVPDSRIDDEFIKAFGAECDAAGFGFNSVIDQPTTMLALAKDILAAGRGAFNTRDGKYSVVRDIDQSTRGQVFTPRNSWGFKFSRTFTDAVHALRVQFINPEADWAQDERIVYDDGYGDALMVAADPTLILATNFETLQIRGCTDADQAWRLGRYHLADARLRPTTYTLNVDPEYLVCNRGDRVGYASDVIKVGKAYGRVLDADYVDPAVENPIAAGFSVDVQVTPEDGNDYGVTIRHSDGSQVTKRVTFTNFGERTNYFQLTDGPIAGIATGDLVIFGVMGSMVLDLQVVKIEPGQELTAVLTLRDDAPAVRTAAAGVVPSWTSQINGQPWDEPPAAPSDVTATSSQALSPYDDGGITKPVMMIAVYGPWSGTRSTGHTTVDHIEIRYRQADPVGPWTLITLPYGERSTTIPDVARAKDYQIEARAVAASGAASPWTSADHTTALATLAPDTPTGVSIVTGYQSAGIQWSPVPQADVTYEVGIYTTTTGDPAPTDEDYSYFGVGGALQWMTNVQPGTTTYFRVRARTYSGAVSDPTVPVSWDEPPVGP
ncbi:host specificity factor TipJ family phage tail protein [Terriglobus albidus]|uniref:host specificity factor TipJ family phage tail protein n=1 Tax=Terriglobus albidus TaxID=1592106 RepID=UPI0021E09464|nr:host specificity factor TipJ family phage tail protein [Terriglobus albidus]